MNSQDIIKTLSDRYLLPEKDIEEALKDELIKKSVSAIDLSDQGEISKKRDAALREMIFSNYSRQEGNSIITTVWERSEKKGYCRDVGIRSLEKIVSDLMFRLKQAELLPDEYLSSNTYRVPDMFKTAVVTLDEVSDWFYYIDVDYGSSEGIYLDLYISINKKNEQR